MISNDACKLDKEVVRQCIHGWLKAAKAIDRLNTIYNSLSTIHT